MSPRVKQLRHRGDPFARIARAADHAAAEVLEEDRLLRTFGIEPSNGRGR